MKAPEHFVETSSLEAVKPNASDRRPLVASAETLQPILLLAQQGEQRVSDTGRAKRKLLPL